MKTLGRSAFRHLGLAVFLCAAALSAFADPPSRAIRLKYTSGAVSIQPGGVNDWVEAVVNRPLTAADRVWTDKNSRAELNLGSAALRTNAETSLTLTNVDDDIVQLELDQGTLNLHIRHLFGGETYEVDTPNQAFTILKAGDYRFDVDPNADSTSVTVWKGEGEANGQGNGVRVRSGEQASFTGGTSLEHRLARDPGLDGFDDWCRLRDQREDHAESYRYVSADVVGAEDLDEYGAWRTTGEYGAVWVPRVAPGWAPYHYGHWIWVEPWGWTWVDDTPWGFAPCHYGRWVYTGGYWGWAPGPIVVERPIYAPALVAWVGGPHFGVSVSFGGGGGVGWFPLGWGEPYVPSYAVSRTYFQNVNVRNTRIVNITNVTNNYYSTNNNTTVVNNNIRNMHYANQTVNGAVTAVPTRVMVNSQSVGKAAVPVRADEVRGNSVAVTAPVAPVRTSLLGAQAEASSAAPPARTITRPVVSHMAPPPKPVPFEAKQEALARTPGRPLDTHTEAELRSTVMREAPSTPNRNPAPPSQPERPGAPGVSNPNAGEPRTAPRPGLERLQPQPSASASSNPNAGESKPAPRPGSEGLARPNTPLRAIPRPPQPGAQPSMTNPVPPTNMARPVPRPPQVDRAPNSEASRPNQLHPRGEPQSTPNSATPNSATRNTPRSPQPAATERQPVRPDETRRPEPPPSPNPPQPRAEPRPATNAPPPNAPRPPQPATNAPLPNAPPPPQPDRRPNLEPPTHPSAPRPQAEPRAQEPRQPAEARPQHEQPRPQPKSQQPKHEDKPEKNNLR
jgi:hypothetical protein